ncbi:purine-nucleoside phosphorylase [Anaerosalibacter bizertensis]|uniref:Purine nucleoside phosphorylase n=1 Tax=Anaerosalibacter bizertensis TaxID=932217 RepID=A0A9Q4AAX9_9FIRM|nr:purine-nucleoside phosphorylase [Anaerosalibacter bizertensis]MBV1817411.1 purine-nucleoside phosphorylase [Bacteroidales bacterium MSK.15.36]MBU5293186.1 purine-nucleoside phosphorylase [Anaerosalibacter bizertensis]MCB5558491.1 purine-nucleoside phosphorylase [Anaerosalibacter bizertensis]MCG4564255.1 purine-nucleoside phosphorylase [Anaerosalibacter bizertensis]MCG4581686.1 purine-nucleoside phosphorylase [Anaerosalibacter bizertensis]
MNLLEKINESANYILSKVEFKPSIGIILGSGLGDLAEKIENPEVIKYDDIPNFPISTVEGHKGRLILGELENKKVIAMQGRFHFYEGYPLEDVTFPIRVMKAIGIEIIIVTNAAGGANKDYKPGDLMLITDHINFTGRNPLMGRNIDDLGPRFLDMTSSYDKQLIEIAKNSAKSIDVDLKEGVYMWFTGPTYETPSEVRLARTLGADAVGMSTVPEVIVARHGGMKVLGISCITNMAAGILDKPLNHEEVVETSEKVKGTFEKLIRKIVRNI